MRKSASLSYDFMEEHIAILQNLSRTGAQSSMSLAFLTGFEEAFTIERLLELARLGLARRNLQTRKFVITPNGRNVLKDRDLE